MAQAVTDALEIPTIGIGAGPHTTGQVLVYHDLLGIMHHPHHEKHVPSFCKKYANIGEQVHNTLLTFKQEVHDSVFPSKEYCPYTMSVAEESKFKDLLHTDANARQEKSVIVDKKLREADEYEIAKLY